MQTRAVRGRVASATSALCAALLFSGAAAQERVVVAGSVVDASGRPADGATVCVGWCNHPELPRLLAMALGDPETAQLTTTTDAQGRFRCEAPDAAPFALFARRGEEMSRVQQRVLPGDFVRLELATARRIAGDAITPHADVELRLVAPPTLDPSLAQFDLATLLPAPSFTTRADARGAFAFAAPQHPNIELRVRHEGTLFSFPDADGIRFPDPTDVPLRFGCRGVAPSEVRAIDTSDPSRELSLDENGAVRREIWNAATMLAIHPDRLPGVFEPILTSEATAMEHGSRLQARLRHIDGAALAGTRLVFARPFLTSDDNDPLRPRHRPWIAWTARTDGEGRTDNRWLEPGVPLVAYAEVRGRFVCFFHDVPAGDVDLGTMDLGDGYTIRGRVTTHDHAPATGAWVFVQPELPRPDADPSTRRDDLVLSRAVLTDNAGRFRAEGSCSGKHRLIVRAPDLCVTTLTAAASADAPALEVRLPPPFVVRGIVLEPNGQPAANARVHLVRGVPETTALGELPFARETRSAADGTFAFPDAPPETLMLHAFAGQRRQIRHAQASDVPIDGTVVELRLPPR